MIVDLYTKIVLTIIAASLFVLSLATIISPINVYAQYDKEKTIEELVELYGIEIVGLLKEVRDMKKGQIEIVELLKEVRDINKGQWDKTAKIHYLNKNIKDILLFIQHRIFLEGINVRGKNEGIDLPVK